MSTNSLTRICFTEAEDDLLAKGWPRMARLVDGHSHDKSPAKSARAWIGSIDPKQYLAEWPREVAHRVLRAGPIVQIGAEVTKATAAALDQSGPPSKDEARDALRNVVCSMDEHTYEFKVQDFVYLTETILGADATLDAIVEGLEKSKPKTTSTGGTPMESYVKKYAATTVGFLLLRAKKPAPLRKRLEAQHARFQTIAKKANDWEWCALTLDLALNGAAAYKRALASGWRINLRTLEDAHDDPDLVRDCVAKEAKQSMSVRLAGIAGPAVLANLAKRKFAATEHGAAVRDFGMVRAPEVVDFILSLVGKASAKDAPMKWFEAHADYARPIVAKSKSPAAKAVLSKLGTM
jgi:hypothetical protein